MCLCGRPFRWSCGGVEAKHVASPNAACPWLHRKPLDAAIGQLLAPYRPGGWRKFVAFIKATKRRHRASTRTDITNRTRQRRLISKFHREKGLQLTCWPLLTMGMTNQTVEKHLNNNIMSEYYVGGGF